MADTATGAEHSMSYVEEATYGVTPATPIMKNIRSTGATLGITKNVIENPELRDDRQTEHLRHGTRTGGGDMPIVLSYSSFDDFIEAALCGAWTADTPAIGTDQLKAGKARRSFMVERKFGNLTIPEYHRSSGLEINTFSLSVKPDDNIAGSFATVSKDIAIDTAIISGATYPAATSTIPFDAFSGAVTEGGSAIGIVTTIDMTLENGITPLFAIGSKTTLRPGIGKSKVTGTLGLYFQSSVMLSKFIDETASSLVFTLVDPDGNQYQFEFPNIKYTGGQPDVSGEGEIIISLPFTALYDSVEQSQIVIERTPI